MNRPAHNTILEPYRGRRVLVLGASGFIGSWVARKLAAEDIDLRLVVQDPARAAALVGLGTLIQSNLRDPEAVRRIYASFRPSITFNLAGYGVNPLQRDPECLADLNAALPRRICEAASESGSEWPGQAVISAGSALEYGTASGDLDEAAEAIPNTSYGRTKLEGTLGLAEASRRLGVAAMTARLFTVYGPGEIPGRLVPSLIAASRTGSRLEMTEGTQQRDFTYVEDVAEGLIRLGFVASGTAAPVVNLATGRLMTVRQFVETAVPILGLNAGSLHFGVLPSRCWEMEHGPVSIRRLVRLISWFPPTDPATGIRLTLEGGLHQN